MNKEFEIRKNKAEEINVKINNLTEGILIVGSVAYNPEAVTEKSDLDLVAVVDFSSLNFEELYKKIGQKFEPILVNYAKEGKIQTVSIVWDEAKFEVGLHLWDKSAFMNVVNLKKFNLIFRRKNFFRNFKSTSDSETLLNLKGEKKEFYKEPKEVDEGAILKFFIFQEDEKDFYPGIQMNNLLLKPKILSEKDSFISNGIKEFRKKLKAKLIQIYKKSSKSTNWYNSLDPKLKEKVGDKLRKELEEFF